MAANKEKKRSGRPNVTFDSKITDAQRKVLCLINERIQKDGCPPTYKEIAEELGFKSVNSAVCAVKYLSLKGYVEIRKGTNRCIRVLDAAFKNECQPKKDQRVETEVLMHDFMAYRAMYVSSKEELSKRMPEGLTAEQFIVLKMLSAGDVHAEDLAERSGVLATSLSRMLNGLESMGAIKRTTCLIDNRRRLIKIRPQGKQLLRMAK